MYVVTAQEYPLAKSKPGEGWTNEQLRVGAKAYSRFGDVKRFARRMSLLRSRNSDGGSYLYESASLSWSNVPDTAAFGGGSSGDGGGDSGGGGGGDGGGSGGSW